MPDAKPEEGLHDDDESMPENNKTDEGLSNGSPGQIEAQKENNEADDSKELADGELLGESGDESKAADAPETIDLGKYLLRNSLADDLF